MTHRLTDKFVEWGKEFDVIEAQMRETQTPLEIIDEERRHYVERRYSEWKQNEKRIDDRRHYKPSKSEEEPMF